jgi:RNA polymerase sigma-70 factor (ECF subfamily)
MAFTALVRMHQGAVRRQLRRLTHPDAALADDLAQDAFVSAWRGLAGYRGDARFATWLHRIALRTWLMHRRAQGADPVDWRLSLDAEDDLTDPARPRPAGLHDDSATPGPELALDMDRALASLPLAQRVAVLHCCVLELSHDEAARVLGIPLGTVKAHVARGKARLRRLLAAWAPPGLPASDPGISPKTILNAGGHADEETLP